MIHPLFFFNVIFDWFGDIDFSWEGSHTGGRRLLAGGPSSSRVVAATGSEGTGSVPVMTEAGAVPERVSGDILIAAEPEIGDGTSVLVSAEAASLLGQEGDSSVVEGVPPQDKGRGVAVSKGGLCIRSTYGREHVGRRPSKGWLSRFRGDSSS